MKTDDKKEIWKDIPGFERKYQASSFGRIRSLDRKVLYDTGVEYRKPGKILTPYINKNYEYVSIVNRKNHQVHRLVMLTFFGPSNMCVDHIDNNSKNNKLNNLQYVTRSENTKLSFQRKTAAIGSKKNQSKLTEKDVSHIKLEIDRNISIKKIADGYKVSISSISMIKNGKTWKHVR